MEGEAAVRIRGTGVAAACCQHLLQRAGRRVWLEPLERPRVPAIMLNPATQALLADVTGKEGLFEGSWRIRRRVVRWGNAPLADLPHRAVVVSEAELLRCLEPPDASEGEGEPDWTVHTSRAPEGSEVQSFGNRMATAAQVRLSPRADAEACLVEAVPSGWLFLVPVSVDIGWLLSAGAEVAALQAESKLVAPHVDAILTPGGAFPSHPRIAAPLAGEGWLACGSAALGFDPLCGDGTGHAIREAILAAAVIRGPHAREELLDEYRLRLWAGVQRHLELCQQFYSSGGDSEWWRAQHGSLQSGIDWIGRQRGTARLGRFRLEGFSLARVDAA